MVQITNAKMSDFRGASVQPISQKVSKIKRKDKNCIKDQSFSHAI